MAARTVGAGLASFSNFEPRVTTMSLPCQQLLEQLIGFGVVIRSQRGRFPSHRLSCSMSQVPCTSVHAARPGAHRRPGTPCLLLRCSDPICPFYEGAGSINKFDTAGIPVSPHHTAMPHRL